MKNKKLHEFVWILLGYPPKSSAVCWSTWFFTVFLVLIILSILLIYFLTWFMLIWRVKTVSRTVCFFFFIFLISNIGLLKNNRASSYRNSRELQLKKRELENKGGACLCRRKEEARERSGSSSPAAGSGRLAVQSGVYRKWWCVRARAPPSGFPTPF